MKRLTYFFGAGKADGDASMKELLGGKGANLAEMSRIGLPIPAGFTITTEVCAYFSTHGGKYPHGLEAAVLAPRAVQRQEHHVDAAHQASSLGLIADVAARLEQKLKWDPIKGQFVDNAEANKMLKRPMHNGYKL